MWVSEWERESRWKRKRCFDTDIMSDALYLRRELNVNISHVWVKACTQIYTFLFPPPSSCVPYQMSSWMWRQSLGNSILCAVGSEDAMEIDYVWKHFCRTVIDVPSSCIFIFSFTDSLSWLSAGCAAVCYPVMAEVKYPNHELVCRRLCFRWQCWRNILEQFLVWCVAERTALVL